MSRFGRYSSLGYFLTIYFRAGELRNHSTYFGILLFFMGRMIRGRVDGCEAFSKPMVTLLAQYSGVAKT